MRGNERPDSPVSLHGVCVVGTEPHAEQADSSRASAFEGIHASKRDDSADVGQGYVVLVAHGLGVLAEVHR